MKISELVKEMNKLIEGYGDLHVITLEYSDNYLTGDVSQDYLAGDIYLDNLIDGKLVVILSSEDAYKQQ